jgi:hypothetical protein
MARLNASARNALPSSKFGLPEQRKYPVNDRSHAAKAKGRATEMERKGRISKGQEQQIDARANKVLGYGR